MKGDRPALSGANRLAATLPASTRRVRRISISASSSRVQAMKATSTARLGEGIAVLPGRLGHRANAVHRPGRQNSRFTMVTTITLYISDSGTPICHSTRGR